MDQKLRSHILSCVRTPRLRTERAVIVTNAHKKYECEPAVIKRAKVFRALANEMPVSIEDWQLVVGNYSSEPFTISVFPESNWRAVIENLDTFGTRDGDKYIVTEEDKAILREILPWWEGKAIQDHSFAIMPDDVRAIYEAGVCDSSYLSSCSGNFTADYGKVITLGMEAIKASVQEKYDAVDISNGANVDKWLYYKAVLICCDAAMEFAGRYADLAEKMAAEESRPDRKAELEKIAKVCRRAIRYPAKSFSEAVQTFWFLHVLVHFESAGGAGIVAGRLDQYLYPYYKTETPEEVRKWLKNLWINYNQILYFLPGRAAKNWSGHPVSEQPTIGGVKYDGSDACNELTEMMLEIETEVAMPQPDIALMYHPGIKDCILEKACDSMLKSMKPKVFSLDAVKRQDEARGIYNLKDQIDTVDIGCVATGPQGKTWGNNGLGFFNLGKVLELTLFNGVDPNTGNQVGLQTGDPVCFSSYEEFYKAYCEQLAYCNKLTIQLCNIVERIHRELNPQAFTSIMIDDCLERGVPLWEGGAKYNVPGVEAVGLSNVADSLAAVKKMVYEDKTVSMETLLEALRSDFKGYEVLQAQLKNKAPKYGNDDDYVDEIAVKVAALYCDEHSSYLCARGTKFCPSLCSVSAHVGLGGFIGALPDGRNAGRPLGDGMSPAQGRCMNGPTAIINSLLKIDQSKTTNGNLLNVKFTAETLRNPGTRKRFLDILRTYMENGGFHMQFNIVDVEQLIEAQKNPQKYPELIVRVAAYVAQFSQLPRSLQDDIIARSCMEI